MSAYSSAAPAPLLTMLSAPGHVERGSVTYRVPPPSDLCRPRCRIARGDFSSAYAVASLAHGTGLAHGFGLAGRLAASRKEQVRVDAAARSTVERVGAWLSEEEQPGPCRQLCPHFFAGPT